MKKDRKLKLKKYTAVLLVAGLLLQGVLPHMQGGDAGVRPCAVVEDYYDES